jgi:hypothetical protein
VVRNFHIFNYLGLASQMQFERAYEAKPMTCIRNRAFSGTLPSLGLILFAAVGIAAAQDSQPAPPQTQDPSAAGGWRRFSEPAQSQAVTAPDPEPVDRGGDPAQTPPPAETPMAPPAPAARPANNLPAYGVPAELTLKQGTLVTVRVNDMLSSNRNLMGDGFTAVLTQPLVANGVVVAQRGQMVYGRVAAAQKSHASTPSTLALELTGLTVVDGTQASIRSQLVSWQGGTTPAGQQAGTVIGTTALGTAVGAVAGGGTGAAVGAGAGLAVGGMAALLTRNHPTVVYPETVMTFRVDAPVVISTANAPQAFRYVSPNDYDRPSPMQTRVAVPAPRPYYGGGYYAPYYAPYPYGYWGPYYGGVGLGVVIGRGGFRRW